MKLIKRLSSLTALITLFVNPAISAEINSTDNAKQALTPQTLLLTNNNKQIDVTVLLPRAKTISNVNWSQSGERVSFLADGKFLWLLDVSSNSANLVTITQRNPLMSTNWSADENWLAYSQYQADKPVIKAYSFARKRNFIVRDLKSELAVNSGAHGLAPQSSQLIAKSNVPVKQ